MKADRLDKVFHYSLILKGIDSALEIVGGLILLTLNPDKLGRGLISLTQHELSEDPHDFIANRVLHTAQHIGSTQLFGGIYLLSHGLIKIVLVWALLKNKLWAYPAMMVLLAVFIVYQLYRINLNHSVGLVALTAFDVFILWLTWREFQRQTT